MADPTLADAEALLRWYMEMGVDAVVLDTPVDRFAESRAAPAPEVVTALVPQAELPAVPVGETAARPPVSQAVPVTAAPALLTAPPEAVVLAAREQAQAAGDLQSLQAALDSFEGCALKATASRLVFMDGVAPARLMLVGEAPGREEDRTGRPFVGKSGQLLDRMLAAVGLDRTTIAIANVVPWRPPGNRTPTPQEIAICRPFIERQIELVQPEILVCLGAPSAQTLLGIKEGIMRARGRWSRYETERMSVRAIATLHPAYLLRRPVDKRLAWRDFRSLKAALQERGGTP